MTSRRMARELALQTLYTVDLIGRWDDEPAEPLRIDPDAEAAVSFSRRLIEGVFRNRTEIDERIQRFSRHWTLPRMNLIDRNLLRMAAFELIYCDDIPGKVSINEALELAKRYGTVETHRFLNGILDRIAHEGGGAGMVRGSN